MYKLILDKSMGHSSKLIERKIKHIGSEIDELTDKVSGVYRSSFLIASVLEKQ